MDGYFKKSLSGSLNQVRKQLISQLVSDGFTLAQEDAAHERAMQYEEQVRTGRETPASTLHNFVNRYLGEEELKKQLESSQQKDEIEQADSTMLTFHYPPLNQIFTPHFSFDIGVFIQKDESGNWKVWATDPLTCIQQEDGPLVERLAKIASEKLEQTIASL